VTLKTRVFHGDIRPGDIANALVAEFNQGGLQAQRVGEDDKIAVQIATQRQRQSGGNTALTVTLKSVGEGVLVGIGQQEWLGIAASLGITALSILQNPWRLIDRLDDVAADINSIQLENRIWEVVEHFAKRHKASHQIAERLRTVACPYCDYANSVATGECTATGAPLGTIQPTSCQNCGFVNQLGAKFCGNCGEKLVR